jgi:hypothetical protein
MQTPEYKTIFSSVRPQRVAILININDENWRDSCLRIIEYYSTLWGGKHNIIVPTDGISISDEFWKVLESFDPDYLFKYQRTGLDEKLAKPDEFERVVDRETRKWLSQHPESDEVDTRESIEKDLQRMRLEKLEVSSDLQGELKRRLAPFYFENWIVQAGAISAHSEGHYPLTSLAKILPHTDHTGNAARLAIIPAGQPGLGSGVGWIRILPVQANPKARGLRGLDPFPPSSGWTLA